MHGSRIESDCWIRESTSGGGEPRRIEFPDNDCGRDGSVLGTDSLIEESRGSGDEYRSTEADCSTLESANDAAGLEADSLTDESRGSGDEP
jgi:hypothetical protein